MAHWHCPLTAGTSASAQAADASSVQKGAWLQTEKHKKCKDYKKDNSDARKVTAVRWNNRKGRVSERDGATQSRMVDCMVLQKC